MLRYIKILRILWRIKNMLPDKSAAKSRTITGATIAAILTALCELLPLFGVGLGGEIATAVIVLIYTISALLIAIGARGILGEIALGIKEWKESGGKK